MPTSFYCGVRTYSMLAVTEFDTQWNDDQKFERFIQLIALYNKPPPPVDTAAQNAETSNSLGGQSHGFAVQAHCLRSGALVVCTATIVNQKIRIGKWPSGWHGPSSTTRAVRPTRRRKQGCSAALECIDTHSEDGTDAAKGDAMASVCDIVNAIEAQDVGGERAQACKDAGIASDAAGVFCEATVADVVERFSMLQWSRMALAH